MPERICTGYGSSDSHALILNDGRQNPHPSRGQPYQTITLDEIWRLVQNPPVQPKEQGQWIIPSSYHDHDARSHEAQRLNGLYHMMAADIDQGNPSLQDVEAAACQALGDAARLIYSTRSAKADNKKWRILIPLARPLTGQQYGPFQASLFDALEHGGLRLDRTLERAGQLVYLPNKGDFYEYRVAGQAMLDPHAHPMAKRADQYLQVQQQIETGNSQRNETHRSPVAAFRRKHSIEEMLSIYGYRRNGLTNHWASPYQTSGGFATVDRGDHWISLSDSDKAAGIGRATANGSRYGDAFDLYVHYQCQGNQEQALAYARQCLAAEDNARYGEATAEHGKSVYQALYVNGQPLGPDACASALEEAKRRVENLKVDIPEVVPKGEWDIDFPPGFLGEIAKTIYNLSSRPVKQYSIALALHMAAGIFGARYNAEGFGLNLSMIVVGDSGTGKGDARRIEQSLYFAMGAKIQNPVSVLDVFGHAAPPSAEGARQMFTGDYQSRAAYTEDADAHLEMLMQAAPGSNGDKLRSMESAFWDTSGHGRILGAVTYSKKENKLEAVLAPALTIGRDLQIDALRSYLGARTTLRGHGPRQLYVIYDGPKSRPIRGRSQEIPDWLIEVLARQWQRVHSITGDAVVNVQLDPEARRMLEQMEDELLDRQDIGGSQYDILNRAHMNAVRIAALAAVSINENHPVISPEIFAWAKHFVMLGYNSVIRMLMTGGVGSGEAVRVSRAVDAVATYIRMNPGQRQGTYKTPKSLAGLDFVIPETYFLMKLKQQADFKGNDTGMTSEDIIRKRCSKGMTGFIPLYCSMSSSVLTPTINSSPRAADFSRIFKCPT